MASASIQNNSFITYDHKCKFYEFDNLILEIKKDGENSR